MKPDDARILLIDNYDSFTYNLVQAFAAQGAQVLVYRNDAIDENEALSLEATHLVISPGPGRPEDAGVSLRMIDAFAEKHRACRTSDAWQDVHGEARRQNGIQGIIPTI
jgi:anthranilate/para-aminobenzoate synthase component II